MAVAQTFATARDAALSLFLCGSPLNYKEGGFLGNMMVTDKEPSPKQRAWLDTMLERAGLPPLAC